MATVPRQDPGQRRRRGGDQGVVDRRCDTRVRVADAACGQGSAIRVDDEQTFAVHLVVAVDEKLQRDVAHGGRIRQRVKLPAALRRECAGAAVCQAECKGHGEGCDRQKRQNDEYDTNPQAHQASSRKPNPRTVCRGSPMSFALICPMKKSNDLDRPTTAVPQTSSISSSRLTASP